MTPEFDLSIPVVKKGTKLTEDRSMDESNEKLSRPGMGRTDPEADPALIEAVLSRLDTEVENGTVRMSVEYDAGQQEAEKVSHSCCRIYGREASRMVGELDMYSDLHLKDMGEA